MKVINLCQTAAAATHHWLQRKLTRVCTTVRFKLDFPERAVFTLWSSQKHFCIPDESANILSGCIIIAVRYTVCIRERLYHVTSKQQKKNPNKPVMSYHYSLPSFLFPSLASWLLFWDSIFTDLLRALLAYADQSCVSYCPPTLQLEAVQEVPGLLNTIPAASKKTPVYSLHHSKKEIFIFQIILGKTRA